MISLLIYDSNQDETKLIKEISKDMAAYLTEDEWQYYICTNLVSCEEVLVKRPIIDLCYFDIVNDKSIPFLRNFRKEYEEMRLLLIVDERISPMVYLRPGIRPDSILLRPIQKAIAGKTIREFVELYVESLDEEDNEKNLVVRSKNGNIRIPYKDIYYVEAREKKLYVRTFYEEYGFYETIEKIIEYLPELFVRCHRSYIVNKKKIRNIKFAQGTIELMDEFSIPLSRTYKEEFKKSE